MLCPHFKFWTKNMDSKYQPELPLIHLLDFGNILDGCTDAITSQAN